MEFYPDLHLDRHFRDFNICPFSEPTFKAGSGPSQSDLFKMAYLIREGHKAAQSDFASVMVCTLRGETFQSFQALHGPYAIRYADWFYAKLEQFLGILLYEELSVWGMGRYGDQGAPQTDRPWEEGNGILDGTPALVDPRQVRSAFSPRESRDTDWFRIVQRLSAVKAAGTKVLRKYLRRRTEFGQRRRLQRKRARLRRFPGQQTVQPQDRKGGGPRRQRRRSPSVQRRDSIILACHQEGLGRLEICQRLDEKAVPTTGKMRKLGCHLWAEAITHPDLSNNVQQAITKTLARAASVKG